MELSVEDSDDVSAFVKKLGHEAALFLEVVQGYAELEKQETDARVQQGLADFEDFNINSDLRRQVEEICSLQSERVYAIALDPVDANCPVGTALPAIADRLEESQLGLQTFVQGSVQSGTHVANEETAENAKNAETAENAKNAENAGNANDEETPENVKNEENEENEENEQNEQNEENEENEVGKEVIEASAAAELPSWFYDDYVLEAPEAPPTATASSFTRRWGKRLEGEAAEAAEAEQTSHGRHWRDETSHDHHDHHYHHDHHDHHDPWEGWQRSEGWDRSDGAGAEGAGGWRNSHWQRDAQDERWQGRRTSWQSQNWWESRDDWQPGEWRDGTSRGSNDWASNAWHSNSYSHGRDSWNRR
eukprot:s280_g20.t1